MDMSTSETSDWCSLWISGDTEESTGSEALVSGRSQHEWLDGPSSESSGPPPARASRSRSPARAVAPPIQGTCGPTFFDSSASAGLGSAWANRLAERLAMIGSTESALTWKVKALPSGRLKPRLVRSTLRMGGHGTGGSHWTTPGAKESSSILERPSRAATGRTTEYLGKQMGAAVMMVWATPTLKGDYNRKDASEHSGDGVATQMRGAQWPTPQHREAGGGDYADSERAKARLASGHQVNLQDHMTAQWPTPTVADVEGGRKTRSGSRNDEMLLNGLMWATPAARDWRSDRSKLTSEELYGTKGRPLARQITEASGWTPNGSNAPTEKRGAPNPEFACWLMGWPEELTSGALRAIQSFRKSRRKS